MGDTMSCLSDGPEGPFELSFKIHHVESPENSENMQIEVSCGEKKDTSVVANTKLKSIKKKGMFIYKFPKGMLIVNGDNCSTDTVGLKLLPSGKEEPALEVSSLGLEPGVTVQKELDIDGSTLVAEVTLLLTKPGVGGEPPRQAPRLGASLPYNLYKDIPRDLWDGLFMDGPFVARSEIGTVPLIFSVPHNGKMKSSDPERAAGRVEPDLHTMEIALTAYQVVKKALGPPTIVAQCLNRHWVDVNRGRPFHPINEAYDGPDGQDAYWTFHHNVEDAVNAYKSRGQMPLVIDVHGSANPKLKGKVDPAYGGDDATWMPTMKKTYGDVKKCMWTNPTALCKLLKENGVIPNEGKNIFGGGFTIMHYATDFGANAMQIEFDCYYRAGYEAGHTAGNALGKALVKFLPDHPCPAE